MSTDANPSGVHDLGGADVDGPVAFADHEMADWEVVTEAVLLTLVSKGLFSPDETRYAQERIRPDQYLRLSYYERWVVGMESLLIDQGMLTADEVEQETERVRAQWV